jgi:hypothetical protein
MTDQTWPPRPTDRIVHKWSCCHPPGEDYVIRDKDGKPLVVKRCPSCGAVEREPRRST